MSEPMMVTLDEFYDYTKQAAEAAGVDLTGRWHPEDFASNLVPVILAWATGYGIGYKRGVTK